jgi:DinB superfamily
VTTTIELISGQMEGAYRELVGRLARLSDSEFFWEPVPGCWTVFRDDGGRWTYHYEEPDPVPSPVTTIGWRLVHVALCKVIYHEWAFGARELDFTNIENPHDVPSGLEMLESGHRSLGADLASLGGADLDRTVLTNWGEPWPAWRIFTTMIDHDRHHGGEIGVLRDLYRTLGAGSQTDAG